ncbi:hypothetical protein ACH9EU_15800 [Kocuria sp. M1R5S2]|uniref:hypothetical protein n=1 Tax=Kocuria rhizosphaerae TaxID=3376285 RepID=UPI0037BB0349
MSEVPGQGYEYDEADRFEQTIDAEPPEADGHDEETAAHDHDRSEASSLEANPADVEEQEQEVVLEDPSDEGSSLEER